MVINKIKFYFKAVIEFMGVFGHRFLLFMRLYLFNFFLGVKYT